MLICAITYYVMLVGIQQCISHRDMQLVTQFNFSNLDSLPSGAAAATEHRHCHGL